jgi:hypothetical protein
VRQVLKVSPHVLVMSAGTNADLIAEGALEACLMDFKYGILCQYMITFLAYRPSFMSIILTMFRVTCISRRRSRYHITEGIDGRLRYGSEPQWEYVVFRLVTTPAVGFICGTLLWYVCSSRHLDRSETTFSNVG